MKKAFSIIVLLVVFISLRAQDLSVWKKETIAAANTGASASFLSDEEKKVLLLVNLARMDGKNFSKLVLEPFIKENEKDNNEYVQSLFRDLKNSESLPALQPHNKLSESAAYHANDMGKNGTIGHDSSDGTDCFVRIERYYDGGYMAENCSYGYDDALNIVMQLLIDDGVSSKGHRYNILGKPYKWIGISIKPHSAWNYNCVMDFSD